MSGFTNIPNAIWDWQIDNKELPKATRILAIVARYTICFHREFHELSLSFIAERLGMIRNNVSRELNQMIQCGLIREKTIGNKRLLAIGYVITSDNTSVIKNDNTSVINSDNQEIKQIKLNNLNNPFDEFWTKYPRKNAKVDAEKAFSTAIKKAPIAMILDGVKGYSEFVEKERKEKQFIKLPAGWLRSELWNDYQPVEPKESHLIRIVKNQSEEIDHDYLQRLYKQRGIKTS
ncbi:HTH_ARSR domain containing protein [uncultured Caudovirales phage]|uniref:HTH_ARSR domain containing protein n=1 Tax=uncultured Caudovirales phage TaxID=2100421 RepID=A0A6J7WIK9_9CAUD|nr:HTH_ARSR domain containing protein [uncultured Caudovirales phage]CAB5216970.1 HTH_ARSR domain containing protein [uncultured Caudovirales phage]